MSLIWQSMADHQWKVCTVVLLPLLALLAATAECRAEASLSIEDVQGMFRDWGPEPTPVAKQSSVFFPPHVIERARVNIERYPELAEVQQKIVQGAQPWMALSDDELWSLIFGTTISRAWMVWSDGFCPACRESVTMYNWVLDPLNYPWKVQCPRCKVRFPTNDFEAFYKSGIDEHGVFDPRLADRSLLYNVEHPDPGDPLHKFGVDDGEGYVEDGNRWRFIGYYLVKGVWKQLILAGINNLAAAYVVTGDAAYAHKAGILIDRLADIHPEYNGSQLYVYEKNTDPRCYISPWHDAAPELRQIALAYDQIFDAIKEDASLVEFLRDKAVCYNLANPKASFADIQRNIEDRMFGDVLQNFEKINSNYPSTELTFVTIHTVLDWPRNREEVLAKLGPVIDTATGVDGLSGEKGTCVYAATSAHMLAPLLGAYQRVDASFLPEMLERHPSLRDTYRFHIDTWIMGLYYPNVGDSGKIGFRNTRYSGLGLSTNPGINPSNFSFLWDLYRATNDHTFVQVIYGANQQRVDGLPYDLFAHDAQAVRDGVASVIEKHGADLDIGSINKQEWCLAIMRTGDKHRGRAFSMAYDAGGRHSHANGMNLDIYAYDYDLMPDFGYPQVQFGGWGSPKARWYTLTAAHNTVTVDGKQQNSAKGRTTLWFDGDGVQACRVSCPELIEGGQQYERTVAMIDIDAEHSYFFDVFRVVGGQRHTFFLHSNFSTLATPGLSPEPTPDLDFGPYAQMRRFTADANPSPSWHADWKIDDTYYRYLPPDADLHLRYTPLSDEPATVGTCEAWVVPGGGFSADNTWIPRIYIERRSDRSPLRSTFIGLLEPYLGSPKVSGARRLALAANGRAVPTSHVAAEVTLADGRRDIIFSSDPESTSPGPVTASETGFTFDGDMAFVRLDAAGNIVEACLVNGLLLRSDRVLLRVREGSEPIQLRFIPGGAVLHRGDPSAIIELRVDGVAVQPTTP